MANFLWETSNKALMISFTCYCEALLEYVLLCWTINCDSIESLTITTTDLDITAGLITVGFMRTGSDVPSLLVLSLKMKKMIRARLKLAVKDHITVGLWLSPVVSWRPLITAGSNQEPTVIWCYHCRFEPRTDGDKIAVQKADAVLSFLFSSIPSTEARVWAAPFIVAAALHREASSWIWKNGLIFFFKVSNKHPLL